MASTLAPLSSISQFTQLSDGQHWYQPRQGPNSTDSTSPPTTVTAQPDLIIFCAWAFAAPKHILKYIDQYRIVYPRSEILLLQSSLASLTWIPDSVQIHRLEPAVVALQTFLHTFDTVHEGTDEPIILAHAFSNGGAHSLVQLAQAYREHLRRSPAPSHLPISGLLIDSSPGKADFQIGIKVALSIFPRSATLARALFTPAAYVLVTWIQGAHYLGIAENIASKAARCLNDVAGPFLVQRTSRSRSGEDDAQYGLRTVPRTYVYSNRDEMVRWQDVLEHAGEARRALADALKVQGNVHAEDVIRLEGFPGTPHVNHVGGDPGRYWRVVRETVERAAARKSCVECS
jgi:hypothetical protein